MMNDIEQLAQKIKPVIAFDFPSESGYKLYSRFLENDLKEPLHKITQYEQSTNGFLCEIEAIDLWNIAYTWQPKPVQFAQNISPYDYFIAKSRYGAPSVFKPAIGEVLQCIPERFLEKTIAFEIDPHDKSVWNCSVDSVHTFLVRVFQDRKQAEDDIHNQLQEKNL